MCGIAGIIELDARKRVRESDLDRMADAMRHRGPDSAGRLIDGSVGLVMRRLEVIDLVTGDQPVWNEERDIAVVQNGEIYNFEDLRDELEARGHRFATRSDTEAIVHLYEETGPGEELPRRLWGMFAFCVYDRRRQIVMLARDRAGQKPLFLARGDRRLRFASELGALFGTPEQLDPVALDSYLALDYVPGPRTVFTDATHLPPGCCVILERDGDAWVERDRRRYWDLAPPVGHDAGRQPREFRELVATCGSLLEDAVRRRLISDVPTGAFLSGGLDSSLLVALMARAGTVRTFSIGFEDPEYDESEAAETVARHLGTTHQTLRMPIPDASEIVEILGALDQPLADPAVIPTWYLSRMTRQSVTVALSGEGADEVFGGYHWYRRKPRRRLGHLLRRSAGAAAELYRRRERIDGSLRASLLAEPLRRTVASGNAGPSDSFLEASSGTSALPDVAGKQTIDFRTWMPDDLLVKVDRMSMAHSLEVRCPYLDHRLVESVLPSPNRHKFRWGRRKAVLRALARDLLPASIVNRKKHGFNVPVDRLLRTTWRDLLGDMTSPARLAGQQTLDPAGVAALMGRWRDDPGLARAVWAVFSFLVWRHARYGA